MPPEPGSKPPRVVFMGTPPLAATILEALCARPDLAEIVGVVTQPDRPAGRRLQPQASAVKQLAIARRLPLAQWTRLKPPATREALAAWAPDLAVVAAYGRILPLALLQTPPLGCVNVHASLLPALRGAAPIAHAIWRGDAETGVCLMAMDEGLDTGAVYARRAIPIADTDTAATLTGKLAELGAALLVDKLAAIARGRLLAQPQPSAGVSLAPPLCKADGALDFSRSAAELARQIRALSPWPGSFAMHGSERFAVLAAQAQNDAPAGPPGTVLAADRHGVQIACQTGTLLITRVKPAGRGEMAAGSWVLGRGPQKGSTLSWPTLADAGARKGTHVGKEIGCV